MGLKLHVRLDRLMDMKPDPCHDEYVRRWSQMYERSNYQEGLAGRLLQKSHWWTERRFGPEVQFANVLEVGAGTGIHFRFVRHAYEHYWLTDLNTILLEKAGSVSSGSRRQVHVQRENATRLSFADNTFERLIAAHVLEHLTHPHQVLREWVRVLKPGGVLSILLPCDPGIAWRLGRMLGPRRRFVRAGIDYDYWMAREHVNALNNLISLVRHYFERISEEWFPFRIPSMDLNLFYIVHIHV